MYNSIGFTLSLLAHLGIAAIFSLALQDKDLDLGYSSAPIVVRLQKDSKIVDAPSLHKKTELPKNNNDISKTTPELPKGFDKLIKRFVSPRYPNYAIKKALEGKVLLSITVNKDGSVDDVTVLSSSGHHLLDQSAQRAAKEWVFQSNAQKHELKKEIIFKLN